MGKIILTMQMSLDGVVSGEGEWMTLSDEILEDILEYYDTVDVILVGSNTYSSLADYWQDAEKNSDSALERTIAKRINDTKKIVISRSKLDLVWKNSEQIVFEDIHSLIREIQQLQKSVQKNISVESGVRTWQMFIQNNVFDDLWLFVHPVIVGQGEYLFSSAPSKMPLVLSDSKIYRNGVAGLYYQK